MCCLSGPKQTPSNLSYWQFSRSRRHSQKVSSSRSRLDIEIGAPRGEWTVLAIRDSSDSSPVSRQMSNSEQLVACHQQSEEKIDSSWNTPVSVSTIVRSASPLCYIHCRSTLCLTLCPQLQISKANSESRTPSKHSAGCTVILTLCEMPNDGLSVSIFEKLIEESLEGD